jgi:hypothetical protein
MVRHAIPKSVCKAPLRGIRGGTRAKQELLLDGQSRATHTHDALDRRTHIGVHKTESKKEAQTRKNNRLRKNLFDSIHVSLQLKLKPLVCR